jgi:hypothetical protein
MKGKQHTIPRCVLAWGDCRTSGFVLRSTSRSRARVPHIHNNATAPINSSLNSVLRCKDRAVRSSGTAREIMIKDPRSAPTMQPVVDEGN